MGLAAAFALGDAALEGREIRGLGFRRADAATFVIFVFYPGKGPPRQGGLPVSLSQKPEGLGLGLAAAFVLGDAASCLGILQVRQKVGKQEILSVPFRQAGDANSARLTASY